MSTRDPAGQLLRALRRAALASGCTVVLQHEATVPWASVTFAGARHRVIVSGAGLDEWLGGLPDAELPLRGCFVASCEVERTRAGAVLTLLVLEE